MDEFEALISRNWTQAEAEAAEEVILQRAGHVLFAEVYTFLRRGPKQ